MLALKVDVDTYRGTRLGVPRLMEILNAHQAGATFLFSLGPDHTGRAVKRVFRPGFMRKVSRTSVLSHYGLKTMLYGTVLPGPDIGRECAQLMRTVRNAGFEVGIHTWDHVQWQDRVRAASNAWTEAQMAKARDRFIAIFGEAPALHGAAGWQMNRHAYRLTQRLGFRYASDTRGTTPFIPVVDAEIVNCPQFPTTLPTLDELIGVDGINEHNVAAHLLERTRKIPPAGHVYTLHAELEGAKLAPVLEALLRGWREQGYKLVALRDLVDRATRAPLAHHRVALAEIPGRSGALAVQAEPFLPMTRSS